MAGFITSLVRSLCSTLKAVYQSMVSRRPLVGLSSVRRPLFPLCEDLKMTESQPINKRSTRVAREWLKYVAMFVMLLTLGSGNMWGQITVDENPKTSGTYTITCAKGSGATPPADQGDYIRCYANNTITISTTGSNMTTIVIAWTKNSKKDFAVVTANAGTYSHPSQAGNGTWTGNANSVTFTVGSSGQIQITTVTITTSGGGGTTTCATPTFSPAAGSYIGTQSVTISSTTTGSTIYYTTDGSTPTTGSAHGTAGEASATVSVSSNMTLKAIAVKDGANNSTVGTAEYSIVSCGGDDFNWNLSTNTYTTGTDEVTWSHTYATMHNAGTNATNYLGGDANNRTSSRFYNDNTLIITPASGVTISHVVFTATTDGYAGVLRNSTWSNATASGSGTYVIVTPTDGTSAFSATVGGTCGFTNVNVCYSACSTLGSINGSINLTQLATPDPTKLKATWAMNAETGIASYTLKVYDSSDNLVKTIDNYTSGSEITGLTPCTTYYVELYTVSSSGSYCEGGLISTSSKTPAAGNTTHSYNVTFPTLTRTTKLTGSAITCASGDYVATFEAASEADELPTASGVTVTIGGSPATSGTDYTWAVSESVGTLTIPTAKQTGDITIAVVSIAHSCSATPTLGAASLSGAFSLSSVGVSCAGITPGSYCAVKSGNYGFIWYEGTASDKKIGNTGVTKIAISTGDYSSGSFSTALSSTFVAGNTYTFRAFATNTGENTGYSAESSFTPRSVTFNSNGGSAVATAYVNSGSAVPEPSAPTRTGYDFVKWQLSGEDYSFSSPVNANITLDANWTPHNFTITYEGLAGAINTNPTSYTIETATINLAAPGSRTGYTFSGWTLGGSPITQIVLGTTGDKTITATWSINTPNLAVSAVDHVVITATPASESAIAEGANRNVIYNKTVTLNCTPDAHYSLVWDVYKTGESSTKVAVTGSGDGATFTMPDYNVTVSAVMTEAAYKTVCFKNNGEDIDGYASVKVYVGESPVAPTLTDGTSGDACDPTSDKHYGWTKETWTSTIATQSEIDERTGSEAVYGKSAALPVVSAGDPSTITYHAVWAAGSGSPAITPPTPIVYWAKQSLSTGNSYSATSGSGSLSTNVSMTSDSYPYVYTNTNISSAPVITLSGLNLSGASTSTVSISFFTRGSKASAGPLTVSYFNNSEWTDIATTATVQNGEVAYHEIAGIPKTATSVKLTHSASSGSFSIGTIRIFEPNTTEYTFTELDGTNTDGWTNSDWDGYYLITNASTYALDGNGIGEKNFATVSPSDNKIVTTNIGAAFDVTYVSENGYKLQGVGSGDYLNTASNSVAPSASVIYHSSMSYNSVVDNSSNTLKWNNSKFGFYASAGTAIKLYKILASYSTFLTTCCTQYDISGASTSGTVVTGGTLTSTYNSSCEGNDVKITATVSTGHRFDGWNITSSGSPVARKDGSAETEDGKPIYFFTMPAGNVTVSATITLRTATVTLGANSGTGDDQTVTATYGTAMPLTTTSDVAIAVPTKTGAKLLGYWDTDASSGGTQYYAYDGSTLSSARAWDKEDESVTLYARWLTVDYYIDDMHGTTGYTGAGMEKSGAGYTVPGPIDEKKTGNVCETEHYIFVGWVSADEQNTDGTLKGTPTIVQPGEVKDASGTTYYAVWAEE